MSWPLTGKPLAEFNRMLSDWKQYTTFPFIGPDDINRLYDVLIAAGVTGVTLTDVGVRPQYWLLQLVLAAGSGGTGFSPVVVTGISEETFWEQNGFIANATANSQIWSGVTSFEWVPGGAIPCILIQGQSGVTSINFPNAISIVRNFQIVDLPDTTSVLVPSLTSVSNLITIKTLPSLSSLAFPSLTNTLYMEIQDCPLLTSVSFPSLVISNANEYYFNMNAFDQAMVDSFLARAVANPAYVSGVIDLSGGTNSAPSITGQLDKLTLQGRGVSVTTN